MRPPLIRIHRRLAAIEADPLTPQQIEQMLHAILTPRQKAVRGEDGGRSRLRRPRPRPLPRQRLSAARYAGGRLPQDPVPDPVDGGPGAAAVAPRLLRAAHGAGAGHRADRQRQVDDSRRDDPHITDSGPMHIITIEDPIEFLFTRSHVATISQREVGTDTGASATRCATHAPGSRRDHGRRDARPRDRGDRDHRGRDRPPGLLDAPHQQRRPDRRSHRRHLPGRPAGAGSPAARARC